MTNLGERIRALATGQAAFYRLKMQLTDNSVRVFPPEEGGYYKVGESPHPIRSDRTFLVSTIRSCGRL